jgi:hypothetical protein
MDPEKLHLDHDHAIGAFRAWVCNACNKAAASGTTRSDGNFGSIFSRAKNPLL